MCYMGSRSPAGMGNFGGCPGLKSIGSLCCGVCSKMDHSILNNAMTAGLLQPTAMRSTGRCHIKLPREKSTPCDAAFGRFVAASYLDKGKGFPYSLTSVGPGADPGVQAFSPQVTDYKSSTRLYRLSLFFARPVVTFPAAEHHRPLAGTKLYCWVTEAHKCEQLVQGC